MMKPFLLISSIVLLSALGTYAQTREVKGVVQDSTKSTIPGAVLKLISPSDSLNVVTNADGQFDFAAVKGKQFTLTIVSIGYTPLKRKYVLDNDTKPAIIGPIVLKVQSNLLKDVTITDVNAVRVATDTTEYKASAYPVAPNAPVEDVLKKLPGVDVDKDGNVTTEGKPVTKVRINGKDFFGGDVKTATKNLPADVIESIQMVDDYGDQANQTGIKTGEPNKIMNIVIRQDKNYGYSASLTGGDGNDALPKNPGITNDNRYVGSTNSFKFKGDQQIALLGSINNTNVNTFSFGGGGGGGFGFGGGGGGGRGNALRGGGGTTTPQNGITLAKSLGLNFRDQWGKALSVYGSYSFADNSTNTISTTQQSNSGRVNNQNSNETDGTLNHRLTWNMEYKPDTVNYIKFVPTYSYSSTTTASYDANDLTGFAGRTVYVTNTNANSHSPNYGADLLYNHRFNGHGRNFSIDANISTSPSYNFQNPQNTYTVGLPTVPRIQLITINGTNTSVGTNLSYIEPLGKGNYLEANYAYNRSQTNNRRIDDTLAVSRQSIGTPQNVAENNWQLLSNTYDFTFTTNRFGLNYRLIKAKYNLTLGGGIQPSVLDGYSPANDSVSAVNTHRTNYNFIPTARFVYNFSRSQALSINYNGGSNQPSYTQLNPRIDYSNALYPVVGNPLLNPEFNNNFSIRYNKFSFGTGDILFSNLSFTQTDNKIVTNVVSYPKLYRPNTHLNQAQLTEYLNDNGYYSANAFFTYAKPWQQRKYTLIFNGSINYSNNIGYATNVDSVTYARSTAKNIAKILAYTPGMRFRYTVNNIVDAQIGATYSVNHSVNSNTVIAPNSTFETTNLTLNGKNYFDNQLWTLSYDYTKTIYQGYNNATNPNILNAYVERRFLKNNIGSLRASAFDIFNENTGFTNSQAGSSLTQSSVNRLGRYYLLTLTIRLQKFAGKAPDQGGQDGGRRFRDGGGQGGGGRPGGGGFGGAGGN